MLTYTMKTDDRKALVTRLGELTGKKPHYNGVPGCTYTVGAYEVAKDGTITVEDEEMDENIMNTMEAENLIEAPAEGNAETPEENEVIGLTIELPKEKVDIEKLTKILESKDKLIRKALGTETTAFTVTDDKVAFPWFNETPDAETADAATKLIAAIGKMSKNSKRITATEKEVESERYAFRGFLIRLGFSGPEYKETRKRLLQNLTGSSAFRNKEEADKFAARQKALRDARKAEAAG